MFTPASLLGFLSVYTYWVIFPIAIIEGPIVTILSGFLVSQGQLNFFLAFLTIILADLTGDVLYYMIGRFSRKAAKAVHRNKLDNHFLEHGRKTLLIGKLAHGTGSIVLVAAGVARMPFAEFMLYNLLPTLPKTLILLIVGYYFGGAYNQINSSFDRIALVTLVIVVTAMGFYLLPNLLGKKDTTPKD